MVSSLIESRGHENIIGILAHGWLKGAGGVYFIDMELGNLTLHDYIEYLHGTEFSLIDISSIGPGFVQRDCSASERLNNLWTIGIHVARGLEFLHSRGHVHRDLKPSNGTYLPQR